LAGPVSGVLEAARNLVAPLYDGGGIHAFRAKLRPRAWDPIHLVYPASRGLPDGIAGSIALFDALTAFARGHLSGFGLRTLLRGPAFVVRALAVLLVPWTILLALVGGRHFPWPWVQAAWVSFDVV